MEKSEVTEASHWITGRVLPNVTRTPRFSIRSSLRDAQVVQHTDTRASESFRIASDMLGSQAEAEDCMRAHRTSAVILVLEQDQELRDAIAALLSADGYRVISARDDDEAILRTQCECPKLILTGMWQSKSETSARAKRTRERMKCSDAIPIILFSDNTIPEGSERELGEKLYVTNPDNFDQLREFVRRLMPA